jgi:hypothetical protein
MSERDTVKDIVRHMLWAGYWPFEIRRYIGISESKTRRLIRELEREDAEKAIKQ